MTNFQSIAAPLIVLITLGVMIYFRVKNKGGSCGSGCCSAKPSKILSTPKK